MQQHLDLCSTSNKCLVTLHTLLEHRQLLEQQHINAIHEFWNATNAEAPCLLKGAHHDLWQLKRLIGQLNCGIAADEICSISQEWIASFSDWPADRSPGFENCQEDLVALMSNEEGYLCVHRFRGERIFNFSFDDLATLESDGWHIEPCHFLSQDAERPDYCLPELFVYGQIDFNFQNWRIHSRLSHQQRATLEDMCQLLSGSLSVDSGVPLLHFKSNALDAYFELSAQIDHLHELGRQTIEERYDQGLIRRDFLQREQELTAQKHRVESAIFALASKKREALYQQLEDRLGYRRGQSVTHLSSGVVGVLTEGSIHEIEFHLRPSLGNTTRTRLITEELRRKEWVVEHLSG